MTGTELVRCNRSCIQHHSALIAFVERKVLHVPALKLLSHDLADVLEAIEALRLEAREARLEAREDARGGFQAIQSAVRDLDTQKVSMSNASGQFAAELLADLGLKWDIVACNVQDGENSSFSWDGGEEACTPRAITQIETAMRELAVDGDKREIEFRDVRKNDLLTLKVGRKVSPGQTDVTIGLKEPRHSDGAEFAFVIGMVELKTDKANLKSFQQLLELVAMSRVSQFRQGVALLGTDLNTKWEVLFFDKRDHITVQPFQFGTVAIQFFQEKLQCVNTRVEDLKRLSAVSEIGDLHLSAEGEQDLRGFGGHNYSVEDRVQDLKALERHFNENYNANVTLPFWALSSDASGIYS